MSSEEIGAQLLLEDIERVLRQGVRSNQDEVEALRQQANEIREFLQLLRQLEEPEASINASMDIPEAMLPQGEPENDGVEFEYVDTYPVVIETPPVLETQAASSASSHRVIHASQGEDELPEQWLEDFLEQEGLRPAVLPEGARAELEELGSDSSIEPQETPLFFENESDTASSPATSYAPRTSVLIWDTETCLRCADPIAQTQGGFLADCGHTFCDPCLSDYISYCLENDSSFPPQCCQRSFDSKAVMASKVLSKPLIDVYTQKLTENKVPRANRVYCANPKCSAWLGDSTKLSRNESCTKCTMKTCTNCRSPTHASLVCQIVDSAEDLEFVDEAKREWKFQRCPHCRQLVMRTEGCPHIVCRCKGEFCYSCGEAYSSSHACRTAV